MQVGMVGLGRMGANMVRRLLQAGHQCVVWNRTEAPIAAAVAGGAIGSTSLADFVSKLDAPRAVWMMVPAGATGALIDQLAGLLSPGDILIDGGNSNYHDDITRAKALREKQLHFVDCGTSGGVFGLERGYCCMVGADNDAFTRVEPIFQALAPGVDAAPRTPGRSGSPAPEERGYLHCGPPGAGHFVKMIHNGVEYAIMEAYAEGLNVLHHADIGEQSGADADAEITPLRDPYAYQYDIDVAAVSELWRRGSVISSWLLDLTAASLHASPTLAEFEGRVSDSGEGRWTVQAAIDEGIPVPLIANALFTRFASRGNADFGDRLLSAMRNQFGGHNELPSEP
jgi:6-phosphogluconate dehydrogenase